MNSSPPDRVDRFMELLVSHQGQIYQYVRMLMPRSQDVDDVLQQTFLVMWRKFDESYAAESFYTWATRIAYLEVLKARAARRELSLLDDAVLEKLVAEEAREPDFLANLKMLLEACLDKLSPPDRELIERRYQPGVTVNALALELGRPANSVSKSLGRIRHALWKCIEESSSQPAKDSPERP